MSKAEILQRIRNEKVIALIRADSSDSLLECARALLAGGLGVIELTMTTPNAIAVLAKVSRELPGITLGLGTVLDAGVASEGVAAGARFIVTPCVRPDVIAACRGQDVPVLAGALTPTEVANSWDMGADVIKIFPAEFFGPAYIKSLRGPFPKIELLPTGGVTPQTVGEFLRAGAFATAAGSSLIAPAALKARDWAQITARAQEFVKAAAAA
ncbi:MAG TPA: bifunctional 4-hydroxy-2-oxoglutarate aldolase/2-dehydro-3-deoxy-phosphogluconate aldolase [Opitutaceae bacterium]|nr:bifunctional 4-hydroxy-2-oxoglutarate aldolase/2-dehydro-3-deoxy-phosphogluconate aldolase [Opitutaceae bacterium]